MSRSQRLSFLAIAAAIAVVAIVVLSAGGGDERGTAQPALGTQSTVVGNGEGTASPQDSEPIATTTTESRGSVEVTPEETPTPEPEPELPVLSATRARTVEVDKGDTVRFAVRSGTADRVHVHGYDLFKDVKAGGRVEFAFKATIDGIYEIELENSHTPVGRLRVNP